MKLKHTPSEIRAKKDDKRLSVKAKPKTKRKFTKPKKGLNADHLKGENYAVFLNSKYWNTVRNMVLKRDKFKCVICSETKLLQVHHNSYKNHFNEHKHLEDLMTLCKSCHQAHHYAQP